MSYKVKLLINYDGTDFEGWQRQPQGKPTIQSAVEKDVSQILTEGIHVQKACLAPEDFHAQRSAVSKTYKYYIWNSKTPDPIRFRFSTWLRRDMDIARLNALSEVLLGEKDFKSFQTSGTELKSTVRTITEARWSPWDGEGLIFQISGSGFLKQMVRNIVGTLIYLDQNAGNPMDLQAILAAQDRQIAKGTAPAQGLFLEEVIYPPELDNRCREI